MSVESDGALIRRYAEDRDDLAFTALVERHGKLVWGVGLRMLRRREDAEDAFQAVFLVLSRRAKSLSKELSLAAWLHGVTIRVCLAQNRASRRRQRRIERAAAAVKDEEEMYRRETLRSLIDQELRAMPLRYREVLIMCDIEGFTREEVADRLHVPAGTICSRLARGREKLKRRLVRQGIAVATGGAAMLATLHATAATPPTHLPDTTLRSADAFAWGAAAAKTTINIRALTLAEGVLRAMMLAQWKTVVCVVLLMCASLFSGLGAVGDRNTAFAGINFKDDFSDGDISDGKPVTWTPVLGGYPETDFEVANGDLRVFTSTPGASALLAAIEVQARDLSIRARIRIDGNVNEGAGIGVRAADSNTPAANFELDAHGGLWFYNENGVYGHHMDTDLRPSEEDVILQVDAFGDVEKYWAWRAADSKPDQPFLQRNALSTSTGAPIIYYGKDEDDLPGSTGAAVFRYVQIADRPIVPEPSGGALCAVGGTLLSLGLLFQRRRYRP